MSLAIFDLNPAHIITTNYDHLLEKSSNPLRTQYQVIIRDKDLLTYTHSKYLIKMHGDIDDFNSIVLKEDDYLNYSFTHNLIEWFVRALFTDHVVLFLGYSLNDSNVNQIVSWLNFMRSQNQITSEASKPIGFLVQDEKEISHFVVDNFASKNIEIINIHSIPAIPDIPKELKDERGKRLYSFLKLIAEPSLEKDYFPIYEDTIRFMNQFNFVSCQQILEFLHLNIKSQLNFSDYTLELWNENDYQRLSIFMGKDSDESTALKQLFINAGVEKIVHSRLEEVIPLGNVIEENKLFNNEIYQNYLFNKYEEIKILLDQTPQNFTSIESCFYQSLISTDGYPKKLVKEWEKPLKQIVDYKSLPLDEKVAYMHNCATFNSLGLFIGYKKDNFSISFKRVIQFIESLPLRQQNILFSQYLNIYQGNTQKRLDMSKDLEKLKKRAQTEIFFSGSSLTEFYRLKQLALTEYLFYFNNHILFRFFRSLNQILNPYIEALIYLNSLNTNSKKMLESSWTYSLTMIDLDIITKFITPVELNNLVRNYSATR